MSPIITGLLLAIAVPIFVMTMAGRGGRPLAVEKGNPPHRIPRRINQLLRFGPRPKRLVGPGGFTPGPVARLI